MKKNTIQKIKNAKWQEAVALAENKTPWPLTATERCFDNAHFAIESLKWPQGSPGRNIAERFASHAGWHLFHLIETNDSDDLRLLADAIDERKAHQPGLDQSGHIRAVLIALNGMRRSVIDAKKLRIIRVATAADIPKNAMGSCDEDGWFYTDPKSVSRTNYKITYAILEKNLQMRGVTTNANTPRIVRRIADGLGIEIHFPRPGRPKKTRTKPRKSPRLES